MHVVFSKQTTNSFRRAFLAVPVALLLASSLGGVASAHILRTDGDMSAELHMPPDDAPVTGDITTLQFTFDETKGDFALKNCDCEIEYHLGDKTIANQKLSAVNDTVSRNTITFTQPGDYEFHVTGTPKNGATFAAFGLEYQKHVGGKAIDEPMSPWLWAGITGGGSIVVGYAVYTILTSRAKAKRISQKGTDEDA